MVKEKLHQTRSPLALITGASSGFGTEFARQLAAKGYDLLITARRIDRLNALKKEIENEFGVKVSTCKADLSHIEGVDTILEEIKKNHFHIDCLINNAGYGHFDHFTNRPFQDWEKMITTNCLSLIRLTREILPQMIAEKKGLILNVASVAGFMPVPMYAIYSATKHMVLSFTEALHSELEHTDIHITALCPGPVRTEFFDISGIPEEKNPPILLTTPALNVKKGLAALEKNKPVVIPGFFNKALVLMIRFISRIRVRRAVYAMNRMP